MFKAAKLASNIKKYRNRKGLTQAQLAEKLYMTSQNISKWELGVSMPDIEKLCTMAHIFGVSTDKLLGISKENNENVMMAIDGGGTKTEFVIFNEQAEILSHLILSGSNPNSCGIEKTVEVLKKGIDSMFEINANISAIYAGIAGMGSGNNRKKILGFLKKTYKNIKFEVETDIMNVIYSKFDNENCIAAICGTGSCVYVRIGDVFTRLGGYGYLFDGAGSGYDIGRDVIRAGLEQNDRIIERTRLLDLAEEKIGGNIWEKLDVFYSSGKEFIASFSEIAFELYKSGDVQAKNIIEKNADGLACSINQASRLFPEVKKLILAGGIVQNNGVFKDVLSERINNNLDVVVVDAKPICGASARCHRLFSGKNENFLEQFKINYNKFMEEKNA